MCFEIDELFKGLNTYRSLSEYNCIITKRKICTDISVALHQPAFNSGLFCILELFQGRFAEKCEGFPY